jgi:tyrosyl-tRNA synthetase
MPLFDLLSVPNSPEDWEQYSFATKNQIDLIRSAILKQKNINLAQYVLYPVDFSTPQGTQDWLQNLSQAHDDFNSVLNLQSSDIEDVDLKDKNQLQSWVNLVYQETYTACSVLQI